MGRPTQNPAGALSRLDSQLLRDSSHFREWILSCHDMQFPIAFAYVPKTAAGHCKWAEVLKDLEQIKTSKDIDVSLYTANTDEGKECQEPVMRCFFLETEVILQECLIKNCSKTQDVWNIWKNGNASLENNKYWKDRKNETSTTGLKENRRKEKEVRATLNNNSEIKIIPTHCESTASVLSK
ncbi:interleukin-15 isoform X2 [Harpia harpyja]|uniref:interleukin-15 isoform X2 n=1 Tax=Harpia harpyja TaxID=202280 RepID=UPI0022B1CECF|nr:interleukin-15 isoform X2 [Harpia harpyja]